MSEASRDGGARPAKGRVGTLVNGKWQIDARIGAGGMATVYAATHRNGHRVALKMLHPTLSCDEATRARFLREGYVANAIGHAGVVRVEDDGVTEDGAAFLVLDLLEGDTMEARREQCAGVLELAQVLEIADKALDVLAAAHDKGIVHRDVKPENVFLTRQGEVKLLDFGLALMKSTQVGENTKTGMTIGTPAFMSPEQAQGLREEVDARSDVWGLGATVFTGITGKYVHEAETLREQLIANALKPAPPIRDLAPWVPEEIAVVIDRALELEKGNRWASAREMQRAFRAAKAADSERNADSLTLPAVSPMSIRRGLEAAGATAIMAPMTPRSGPRPNSGPMSKSVPSSDRTIDMKVPSSDITLDQDVPITILEGLPSSGGGPMSPPPTTERLTGTKAAPPAQQSSQPAQPVPSVQVPPPPPAQRVPQHRHDSTLKSEPPEVLGRSTAPLGTKQPPLGASTAPLGTTGPHQPVQAATGSGPYASISSSGPYPAMGSGPYPAMGSGPYPAPSNGTFRPHGSVPPGPAHGSMPQRLSAPSTAPPPMQPMGPAGPVSIRQRKSARTVVIVSLLLIAICAAVGAYILYRPPLPFHF